MKELIDSLSNDKLAKQGGMVYQIWEDGEITLQKSGDLLWQRGLHCMAYGSLEKAIPIDNFPHQNNGHGYAFVTEKGAEQIRNAILG